MFVACLPPSPFRVWGLLTNISFSGLGLANLTNISSFQGLGFSLHLLLEFWVCQHLFRVCLTASPFKVLGLPISFLGCGFANSALLVCMSMFGVCLPTPPHRFFGVCQHVANICFRGFWFARQHLLLGFRVCQSPPLFWGWGFANNLLLGFGFCSPTYPHFRAWVLLTNICFYGLGFADIRL